MVAQISADRKGHTIQNEATIRRPDKQGGKSGLGQVTLRCRHGFRGNGGTEIMRLTQHATSDQTPGMTRAKLSIAMKSSQFLCGWRESGLQIARRWAMP